jgi:hypothetical protein
VKENAKATGCRRIRPKRRPWAARGRDAGCDTRMQRLATGTVCGFLKPEHHFGQRNFLQEPTVPRCCVSRHEQKRRNSEQQIRDFILGEGGDSHDLRLARIARPPCTASGFAN